MFRRNQGGAVVKFLGCVAFAIASCGLAVAQNPVERTPLAKEPVRVRLLDGLEFADSGHRLVIKFVDAARVRLDAGGQWISRTGFDVSAAQELLAARGLDADPLLRLPESKLRAVEERAARSTGAHQPDLAGMFAVTLPDGMRLEDVEQTARMLQDLAVVEFVDLAPLGVAPPGDISPPTPDLTANQTYRGADPGMNAVFAFAHGIDGAGLRLSDCEYGWNPAHEDLNDLDLHLEPGQTIHPDVYANGWDEHGTAVLGETSAVLNGYGCSGMVGSAEVYTYPEWTVEEGFRRETCIAHAIADSDAGDVVLLEMQTTGAGGGYGPAELDLAVWTLVKAGSDAGVVVVAAAGNGNQNLDSSAYQEYRNRGDSGAIIVGAGSSNTGHHKLGFSTYGQRVNVQGWGENVFTIGYGGYAMYGGDENQNYTATFSGTSSASPFVTSAALAVQSHQLDRIGTVLSGPAIRDLLIATGVAQGSGGHIGPFVDLRAALERMNLAWSDLGYALAGVSGDPQLDGTGMMGAGDPYSLLLSNAASGALTTLIVGIAEGYLPFKGGVMVPLPALIVTGLFTQPDGTLSIGGTLPAGLHSDFPFSMQMWIADANAVQGFAASNALRATTL